MHPVGSGPFAPFLGATLVSGEDSPTIVLDVREEHLRSGGTIHGGVLMSLLDMAMASAVSSTLAEGERTATARMTVDFLRPATGERMVARGRAGRRGGLTAYPSAEVLDPEGRVVARATGVWAIRRG